MRLVRFLFVVGKFEWELLSVVPHGINPPIIGSFPIGQAFCSTYQPSLDRLRLLFPHQINTRALLPSSLPHRLRSSRGGAQRRRLPFEFKTRPQDVPAVLDL